MAVVAVARPRLFEPLLQRSIQLRNRIVVSPMCEYSSTDGFANDWHLVHLGSRAVGGAGLVISEAAAVTPEGRISPRDLGIWSDAHVPQLAHINRVIAENGAVSGIQLAHAGRKASCAPPWEGGRPVGAEAGGWQVVAPSAVPFREGEPVPVALDEAGIQQVIAAFVAATHRSLAAGFQLVELHAAHGYLMHQFMSPLSNHRTDGYGGSFENRVRLTLEVVAAVRAAWPETLPLWVRISATDWTEGGWDLEQSVRLAKLLGPMGVDLVDCSSGGNVAHATIPVAPNYQVPFAARIRADAKVATGAVGLITEAAQAEAILERGEADVVLLARELLRDPYWPLHAAKALGHKGPWPVQYLRAAE
jgi:2,4-dienoyl-CoA reductase-like NADH-dependent reductase (Old Yellow Enzyme family)